MKVRGALVVSIYGENSDVSVKGGVCRVVGFPPFAAMVLGFIFMKVHYPVFLVSVFEAGMPSMVMAGVIAAAGNLRADIANAAIGYGILFSFITLPILHGLFQFF